MLRQKIKCTTEIIKYKSDENKIRMVDVSKGTLDWCMKDGILINSVEVEETPMPLQPELSVK